MEVTGVTELCLLCANRGDDLLQFESAAVDKHGAGWRGPPSCDAMLANKFLILAAAMLLIATAGKLTHQDEFTGVFIVIACVSAVMDFVDKRKAPDA
jgi:hypothetical protein